MPASIGSAEQFSYPRDVFVHQPLTMSPQGFGCQTMCPFVYTKDPKLHGMLLPLEYCFVEILAMLFNLLVVEDSPWLLL